MVAPVIFHMALNVALHKTVASFRQMQKKNNQPNEIFTALYLKLLRGHTVYVEFFFFLFQNTSLIYKRNNNLFKLYCNKYFSFLLNTLSLKCRPYVAVTVNIPFGILSELQSYHDYVTLMNFNNR